MLCCGYANYHPFRWFESRHLSQRPSTGARTCYRQGRQNCWRYALNGGTFMAMTDDDIKQAEARMAAERHHAHATATRYNRRNNRVIISLHTGLELALPPHLVEGLADATPDALSEIEISPSGLGLHWPQLDADLYVPALLEGQFGSKQWMARQLGAAGGKSHSPAKSNAARANGLKGGRPRKKQG